MKLNPNLDDGWTRDGITELNFKKNSISGLGISMKVILHLFKNDKTLLFYSYKPADLQEEGDIFIFAIEKNKAEELNLEKVSYKEGKSPIDYWYGEPIEIEEYQLTENIRNRFNFSEKNLFESKLEPFVKYNLYFHDNFIFALFPIKIELLKKVIKSIKHLHSYYLNHAIDSLDFESIIIKELQQKKKIRLKNYQKEGKTVIQEKAIAKKGIKKFLRLKVTKETIIFRIKNSH